MRKALLLFVPLALVVPGLAQAQVEAAAAARQFQEAAERPIIAPPVDAFSTTPECEAADRVNIQPEKLHRVVESLQPCAQALSKRFGAPVSVGAGAAGVTAGDPGFILGVVFRVGGEQGALSPGARSLDRSLAKRGWSIQGRPVRLGRSDDSGVFANSSLQSAVDRCAPPPNVRRVPPQTPDDFVRRYDACLRAERQLGIRLVRTAPGRQNQNLVEVYARAAPGALRGMSGLVIVMGVGDLVGFHVEGNADIDVHPVRP